MSNIQCRYCGSWQSIEFWTCLCLERIYASDPFGLLQAYTNESSEYVIIDEPTGGLATGGTSNT